MRRTTRRARATPPGTDDAIHVFGARNEIVAFQVIVEADARGIDALSVRLPALASARDRITLPRTGRRSDRLRRTADPDLHRALHARDDAVACVVGVRPPIPGGPADPTGWKPVQLVPENARADAAASRCRSTRARTRRSGSSFTSAAPRTRVLPRQYRDPCRCAADDRPIELEVFRLHPAGRKQHARDAVLLERSAELYHGRNLDAAYHRLAHRNRVEFVHAYDERTLRACAGSFLGRRLHARAWL